jgi:hypothetical protein
MTYTGIKHPSDIEVADYLSGALRGKKREELAGHLASCPSCLEKAVCAFDSVEEFLKDTKLKNRKGNFMKRINIYLVLAIISFTLSFLTPRYFLQLLVATLILGAKWVVDSKTTKMLVMINEAWKQGGEKEASKVLERFNSRNKIGF